MPINEGAQPRRANEEQGKPGTNEEQRGPTANGEQRQPREQEPSGAARPGGAARRWAATVGQWSATALRLGARWLHSVPATRAVAAALLVGVGVCLAWSGAFPLGSASADPSHWWSLVTAPFVFPRTSMETVLLIVLFFNCMKNPLLRMSGIAVGLVIGYLIALFWGKVDFSSLNGLPLVTIPVPFKYGFAFDSHAFVVAGAIYLLSVFEAVGDLTATAMVSGQPIEGDEYTRRLRGGVLADGLVSVIATALGSLPLTTFAQNNGVIQMTGVASRHVGKYIAVILVLLGLFPVVGRIFTTIPAPVLGGAMVLMFGLITIAGVRILMTNGIRRRETIIAATSVGLGLGVAFEPEVFQQLPVLFQNSISAGGITAVVLNLLLPLDQTEKPVFLSDDLE